MKMNFTVGIGRNEKIEEIASHARAAEESGFSHITFGDQQNLNNDVYVMMTIAALNTHRIHIGHGVTNPITYHPSIIANGTNSLNNLSGGRAFVGLGTGGNAPLTMGLRPAPLSDLREAIIFIKKYMRGEEAEYKGSKMHSEVVGGMNPAPVYLASTGAKSLQLAGEMADGVMTIGAHPEFVKWKLEQIEKGLLKAGRDPSEIDVWIRFLVYSAESKEAARYGTASYTATAARDAYLSIFGRNTPDSAEIGERIERMEPGLIDEIKRVHDNFDHYQQELADAPHAKLVSQRMIDFFMLTGRPEDICEGIQKIGELGVKTVSLTLFGIADEKGMMREIGDKIMTHFRN